MAFIFYPAILEEENGAFGVFFPDISGCVAAGDTQEEALIAAEEALAIFLDDYAERKQEFPTPSVIGDIAPQEGVNEIARVLVKGVTPEKKIRVNMTLDESLVAAIDKIASNRSEFISNAVRALLAR